LTYRRKIKMTIDLQSFILGMGLVLVIALVVVSVIALIKVMRLEKDGNNIAIGTQQQLDNIHKAIDVRNNEIQNQIGNVYKDMDSRFDKLANKVKTASQEDREEWKNRILEIMRKEGVKNLETIKNKID
jgi:hypothetical protein